MNMEEFCMVYLFTMAMVFIELLKTEISWTVISLRTFFLTKVEV